VPALIILDEYIFAKGRWVLASLNVCNTFNILINYCTSNLLFIVLGFADPTVATNILYMVGRLVDRWLIPSLNDCI
jgi:hypothetical protein